MGTEEGCAFGYVAVKELAEFSDRLDLGALAKTRAREKKKRISVKVARI